MLSHSLLRHILYSICIYWVRESRLPTKRMSSPCELASQPRELFTIPALHIKKSIVTHMHEGEWMQEQLVGKSFHFYCELDPSDDQKWTNVFVSTKAI